MATLYSQRGVRESHPVGHTGFRAAFLAQLSNLLHLRNAQLDPGLGIPELRLHLLVIESRGLGRVHHSVIEANELARLGSLYAELVHAPDTLVVHLSPL